MLNLIKNITTKKAATKKVLLKFKLDNNELYKEQINLDEFEERVSHLQKHFHQPKALADIKFVYCLVGNIVDERLHKTKNETVKGTKHFSPGTKVYCYPPKWGDGYQNIMVIGKHRKSPRFMTMVLSSKYVSNWRLKTVYNPFIVKEMTEKFGWTDKESDKDKIAELVASLIK